MGLFEKLREKTEKVYDKRLEEAARKRSPVKIEVSTQARNRYAIYVNSKEVWIEPKQFIALAKARQIKQELKAKGFEVLE